MDMNPPKKGPPIKKTEKPLRPLIPEPVEEDGPVFETLQVEMLEDNYSRRAKEAVRTVTPPPSEKK
ncbi:MAG: hypothetical protein PHX43_09095 [Alphaproteobacteria bacterium]|nr:hypothetical protein [Alphaproteobacteria bacterium]